MSRQAYQVSELNRWGDVVYTHPVWADNIFDAICLYEVETERWVDYKRNPTNYDRTNYKLKNGNILSVVAVG